MAYTYFLFLILLAARNSQEACQSNQFECKDGKCIQVHLRCNDKFDCVDMSDEEKCNSTIVCPEGLYRCNNGQCVTANARCDGVKQCNDDTDEENCGVTMTLQTTSSQKNASLIHTSTNRCFSSDWCIPVIIVSSLCVLIMIMIIGIIIFAVKDCRGKGTVPGNKVTSTSSTEKVKCADDSCNS